jgi:endonuclease-8
VPEGDTVWRAARRLDRALTGKVLTVTDFRVPAFATWDLSGATVTETVSRGKHLLTRIVADETWTLHTHLKMEGAWRILEHGQRWPRPGHTARVVLETEGAVAVGFQLGIVEIVARAREHEIVGHLGPDLLGPDWDAAEAVKRLVSDSAVPVYVAALDQRNLAGLGNVYANELCFLRGLLPTRPIGDVADLPAFVDLAERMMQANKDRWVRSTTGDLRPGNTSWVYGRRGRPCRRCGTRLLGGELGLAQQERTVTWCPNCQR